MFVILFPTLILRGQFDYRAFHTVSVKPIQENLFFPKKASIQES